MASSTLVLLACLVASALAAPSCVPDIKNFYWKVPCDGQTFPQKIAVTEVKATQLGQPVDARGGMDVSLPLDLVSKITNNYGVINKPLIDIAIVEYAKPIIGNKCTWKKVPTLGILDNIDGCKIFQNCKLENNPTTLTGAIKFKELAGPLYAGLTVDTYYGLSITFKDDKQPIACVYSQDIVIKK